MAEEEHAAASEEEGRKNFEIQRIYLVDVSFESPLAPDIFTKPIQTSTNVDLNSSNRKVADDLYEVMLDITTTVKVDDEVAYLIEVKQAGIFSIMGYTESETMHVLGSKCPEIIYPFSREAICDLAVKGGFPQIHLAPINFDALYAHHLQEQAKAQQQKDDAVKH